MEPRYCFIFVRQDISLAQQVVQSSHATYLMASIFKEEIQEIPHIVLIGVPDKSSLDNIMERLIQKEIRFAAYREPDFGMGLSAISTVPLNPEQRAMLSEYKTWKPVCGGSSNVEQPAERQEDGGSHPSSRTCTRSLEA